MSIEVIEFARARCGRIPDWNAVSGDLIERANPARAAHHTQVELDRQGSPPDPSEGVTADGVLLDWI